MAFGAGERVRTVDLNLGKVALYQLSYARMAAPFCREGEDFSPSPAPVKDIGEIGVGPAGSICRAQHPRRTR